MTVGIAAPPALAERIRAAFASDDVAVACVVARPEAIAGACGDSTPEVAVVGLADGSRACRDEISNLAAALPGLRVIAVVAGEARVNGRRLCAAGVEGIVREAELDRVLVPTVHAVTAGQLTFPHALRRVLVPPTFSVREKQVLALIVLGLSNGEIAAKLWLAESTVKSHLASAFGKLGVRSRSEAAALILDPDQGLGMGILAINPARSAVPEAIAS